MHSPIDNRISLDTRVIVHKHLNLLGHAGYGVTELRTFDAAPLVAYTDNQDDAVRLCRETDNKPAGVYIGVQPRPIHLYDLAPNRWVPARSSPDGNCARDSDIEFITAVFFDIDVVSDQRAKGHPASQEELKLSLQAAGLLRRQDGLAEQSAICCSGNGHYVLSSIVPIPVDSDEAAVKFKRFCEHMAQKVAGRVSGVKIDPVYNLSRIMRVMGTLNRKGQPSPGRLNRRAHFVTEPVPVKSMALHYMILNTEIDQFGIFSKNLPRNIRCNLHKLEQCEFIKWCRCYPASVSEPLWWAMITNLVHLDGGVELIHEISRLDPVRYDFADTQYKIQKAIAAGYRPVACRTIISETMTCPGKVRFKCSRIGTCQARAPMYLAALRTVYKT